MQQQTQISVPKLSKVNKILLISVGVLFLMDSLLTKSGSVSLLAYLSVHPVSFFDGHIYQIVTHTFIHNGLMGLLFNGLLIWFVGSELESLWGVRRYLFFFAFTQILGAIVFVLMGHAAFEAGMPYSAMHGLHGFSSALILAYGILFPNQYFSFMFFFPIKARYFTILIVGIEFYMAFLGQGGMAAMGHLIQMGLGFFAMVLMVKPAFKLFIDGIGAPASAKAKSKRSKSKAKNHLRLVDDDDEKPPKYWQ